MSACYPHLMYTSTAKDQTQSSFMDTRPQVTCCLLEEHLPVAGQQEDRERSHLNRIHLCVFLSSGGTVKQTRNTRSLVPSSLEPREQEIKCRGSQVTTRCLGGRGIWWIMASGAKAGGCALHHQEAGTGESRHGRRMSVEGPRRGPTPGREDRK